MNVTKQIYHLLKTKKLIVLDVRQKMNLPIIIIVPLKFHVQTFHSFISKVLLKSCLDIIFLWTSCLNFL